MKEGSYARKAANDFWTKARWGWTVADCQNLYRELWHGIEKDFRKFGGCYYIDELLNGGYREITLVEYYVITWMGQGYNFIEPDPQVFVHRDSGKNLYWQEAGRVTIVDNRLLQAARLLRDRYGKLRAPSAAREQTIPIQDGSNQKSGNISFEVRPQAITTRQNAPQTNPPDCSGPAPSGEQAQPTVAEARTQADQILADARAQAEQITRSAQDWADQKKREADQILSAAAQKQQEMDQVRARLESEQAGLMDRVQRQIERERQAWDQVAAQQMRDDEQTARALDAARSEVRDTANDIKRTWRAELDDSIHQMRALQENLETRLRDWQNSLYNHQFQQLAICYTQLYRIIRRQESLYAAHMSEDQEEIKTSLSIFRRRFEKALQSLNLMIYLPEPGREYDDVMQMPDDPDLEDPYGMVVAECVVPGVLYRPGGATDPEDCEPICRAEVRLIPTHKGE